MNPLDTLAIETQARALRAAYVRETVLNLFARFRSAPAGNAARA